jgi:hypothetical protein
MTFNPAGFGFSVDLNNETVTFDGGYTVKITEMLDRFGDHADENEDVRFIVISMPPDGMEIEIDLDHSSLEKIVTAPN